MTTTKLVGHLDADSERVSDRLLELIGRAVDTDPLSFERPLHDVVDPDALDTLVASAGDDLTIQFNYAGTDVVVHGDGRVDVSEADR